MRKTQVVMIEYLSCSLTDSARSLDRMVLSALGIIVILGQAVKVKAKVRSSGHDFIFNKE